MRYSQSVFLSTGGSNRCDLRGEWFVDNHFFWDKDTEFEIRFQKCQKVWRRVFEGSHNVAELAVRQLVRLKCVTFSTAVRLVMTPGFYSVLPLRRNSCTIPAIMNIVTMKRSMLTVSPGWRTHR